MGWLILYFATVFFASSLYAYDELTDEDCFGESARALITGLFIPPVNLMIAGFALASIIRKAARTPGDT